MKKIFLIIITFFLLEGQKSFSQSQIITTGNNVVNYYDPTAADIVIGSYANGGTRHDASIMWWSNQSASRISNTADVFYFSVWNTTNANIGLNATTGQPSYFLGNLLIGQATQKNAAYMLDVAGNVRANAIVVNNTGADFVFDPVYKLMPLADVSKYVNDNHHLPGIASAKQMQTDGLNLGDNQTRLLQKVEELTLYLIEKDKQLKNQQAKNLDLEKRMDALEKKVDAMNK